MDGYLLVFAGLLLAAGSLGDRFGRRRALTVGLVVFGAGRCSRPSSEQLDRADRVARPDGRRRGRDHADDAVGDHQHLPGARAPEGDPIWAAVAGLGIALGPIAGGWMIEHFDWSSDLPVQHADRRRPPDRRGAVVPESRDPEAPPLDLLGCGLSFVGLTAVVWALIEAPERGWTDPAIFGALAVGLAVLGAFIAWERRARTRCSRSACSATCGSARPACGSRSSTSL